MPLTKRVPHDFICEDPHHYRFRIGRTVASSLSGFIVGFLAATIIWAIVVYVRLLGERI